jgi:phosphoribosylamine--glycine ligase
MKILLVGGGGREHAIALKLVQSPLCTKLYCAPGNAGIAQVAELVPIAAKDVHGMVRWASDNGIGFVVVASDDPLALGLVDLCQKAGIRAFGPTRAAAEIEWSKVFSKGLMKKYGIPTAAYETFTDCAQALAYIKELSPPYVIKADGLALGKGVVIAQDQTQAEAALREMMEGGKFADSGKSVVIEEFLQGREVTVLCFTDGETVYPMPASRDYKRAFDGDSGPNTGGMGAISPVDDYTPALTARCLEDIILPTVRAMTNEGRKFKGVLYFGLILTPDGPKVIEYNARFGDPEAQVLLPLLKNDLLEVLLSVEQESLRGVSLKWENAACACVVLASKGYPGDIEKGLPIFIPNDLPEDITVFHAGTALDGSRALVTCGGRVLAAGSKGNTPEDALRRVYAVMDSVAFDGAFYRKDIGR